MLYWLYQQLSADGYVPFLNLLKYQTFRTGMALFTAQLVVVAMGSRFIRWMQAKQGKGQPIRADGIERHVVEKAGTPTMGGVMILAGLLVGTLLWSDLTNVYVWAVILVTAGYGVLGFTDDYAKVTKQTTDGVSGKVRLLMEAAIALGDLRLAPRGVRVRPRIRGGRERRPRAGGAVVGELAEHAVGLVEQDQRHRPCVCASAIPARFWKRLM